jgi:hypothetical protein
MQRVLMVSVTLVLALVAAPAAAGWTWPVAGPVLRPFSLGPDPYAGGQHRGIDIGAEVGATVVAPVSGTVSFAGFVPAGGRAVTIETADGHAVTLLQLASATVARDEAVAEGATVGVVGESVDAATTTPHVHLGVRAAADPEGYVDPLGFLPQAAPAPVTLPAPAPVPGPVPAPPAATPTPVAAPAQPAGTPPAAVVPEPASPAEQAPAAVGAEIPAQRPSVVPTVGASPRARRPRTAPEPAASPRTPVARTAFSRSHGVVAPAEPAALQREPMVPQRSEHRSRPDRAWAVVASSAARAASRPGRLSTSVPAAEPTAGAVAAEPPPLRSAGLPRDGRRPRAATPPGRASRARSDSAPRFAVAGTWLAGGGAALVGALALLLRRRRAGAAGFEEDRARIMVVHEQALAPEDPGRRRVAVCERPAAHRSRGRIRRACGHLRPLPPPARRPRPDGERHRRARHAGHGRGGRGRGQPA